MILIKYILDPYFSSSLYNNGYIKYKNISNVKNQHVLSPVTNIESPVTFKMYSLIPPSFLYANHNKFTKSKAGNILTILFI